MSNRLCLKHRIGAAVIMSGLLLPAPGCKEAFNSEPPVSSGPPPATAAIYEAFDYETDRPLMGSAGGLGLGQPWDPGGFNAQAAHNYKVHSGSLDYPDLKTTGGHVATGHQPAITGLTRPLGYIIGADGTRRYLSFLIRPDGELHAGAWNGFFGLSLMSSSDIVYRRDSAGTFASRMSDPRGAELFVGKPGQGKTNTRVFENRGGENQVSSGAPIAAGQTTLLVVRMDFSAIGDTFTLHVNPAVGQPEPTNGVAKTDTNLGLVDKLVLYSTGAFAIDELRIGDTFDAVTPRR